MPKRPTPETLTPNERRFVDEYLVDLNGAQAAVRAGYGVRGARKQAHRMMCKSIVQDAIARAMAERSERTKITADEVLLGLSAIARADPRELVEFRRLCCRHCHGSGFRYQRTAGEMERDRKQHAQARAAAASTAERRRIGQFDEQGGIGYTPKRDPHPECPECFGDGVGEVFVHDTRRVSHAAAKLYAGVRQTREGLEVRMHNQIDAHVHMGRHLGLWRDKLALTDPEGKALPPATVIAPVFNITLTEE